MHIPHSLPLQFGRGLSRHPSPLTIPTDPAAAMRFAIAQDREADAALACGRFEQAERLSHAALEARMLAMGQGQ